MQSELVLWVILMTGMSWLVVKRDLYFSPLATPKSGFFVSKTNYKAFKLPAPFLVMLVPVVVFACLQNYALTLTLSLIAAILAITILLFKKPTQKPIEGEREIITHYLLTRLPFELVFITALVGIVTYFQVLY